MTEASVGSDPSCMNAVCGVPVLSTRSLRLGDLVFVVSVVPSSEVMTPLFLEFGAMSNSGGW